MTGACVLSILGLLPACGSGANAETDTATSPTSSADSVGPGPTGSSADTSEGDVETSAESGGSSDGASEDSSQTSSTDTGAMPSGELLVASEWVAGDWSDDGLWDLPSGPVTQGFATIVPGDEDCPTAQKLRITASDAINSWSSMRLRAGEAPELGQPVTWRWYQRMLLPDSWNLDDLTHGIGWTNTGYNGEQPELNHFTFTDGTYRVDVSVVDDSISPFGPTGTLAKGQWYRFEFTFTQEEPNLARVSISIFDLDDNEVYGPTDFTDWQWRDGETDLTEATFAADLRDSMMNFVGWNSGLTDLDQELTFAEYAAVAAVLGDRVGPYDPDRGW